MKAMLDAGQEGVADQDVVDEFWLAGMDAGVPLVFGDARGEVPQPGCGAIVGAVEAGGTDRGAGRTEEHLGGGRGRLVTVTGQELVGQAADGDGFGAPLELGIHGVAGAFALVARAEAAAGERRQLESEVAHHDVERVTGSGFEAHSDAAPVRMCGQGLARALSFAAYASSSSSLGPRGRPAGRGSPDSRCR